MASKLPKRIALGGGLLAASVALSGLITPAAAIAQDTPAPIVSADYKDDTRLMNYAVNLATGTTSEQLKALQDAAKELGAKLLQAYPEFGTFFVQSEKGKFASELASKAASLNIPLQSIGNTRTAAVHGAEALINVSGANTNGAAAGSGATSRNASRTVEVTPDPNTTGTQRTGAWGVVATGALAAQDTVDKRSPVRVGVIDSGIDGDHEDLKGQIDESTSVGCTVNGIPDTSRAAWQDKDGHGTHVAGTIAAAHNGIGVDGMNPNATLVAIRTGNDDGLFYPEYVACAFDWAAKHNIDITNNSYYVDPWAYWVPTEPDQAAGYEAVRRAVEYATNAGVLNVVAAGNSDVDNDNPTTDSESPNDVEGTAIENRDVRGGKDIPTMLPGVVSVSATRIPAGQTTADALKSEQIRVVFSNYGATSVHIAAPGTYIYSTYPGSKYASLSGTSMASPHVAGALSLLKSTHPTLSNDELKKLLFDRAAGAKFRLLPDPDGKKYEGNGFLSVLPQTNIKSVEYKVGNSWEKAPLSADGKLYVPESAAKGLQLRATVNGALVASKSIELQINDSTVATADTESRIDGTDVTAEANVNVSGGEKLSVLAHSLAGDVTFPGPEVSIVPANTDKGEPRTVVLDATGALTSQAKLGEKVTFVANGLEAGQKVFFYLHSSPVRLGEAVADNDGVAKLTIEKLEGLEVGKHTYYVQTEDTAELNGVVAAAPFEILPADVTPEPAPVTEPDNSKGATTKGAKTLATTGADMALPFGAASLLLLAGAAAAIAGTRKLQRRH